MGTRRRYRKKPHLSVIAFQLNLDTDGFVYQKWGGEQRCKKGDWLVDNDGDVYTVDREVFERTYRKTSRGLYVKTTPIWAEVATESGVVETKEGSSEYVPGDYLVWNQEDGTDPYCIGAEKFRSMYELDE